MPHIRLRGETNRLKDESSGRGRVLLNLRAGRAGVRDDLLLDYILGRLPPVVVDAVKLRAGMDPLVSRRLDELRTELLALSATLSEGPDESLPPEWRNLLRRIGSDKD